jgi:hypothetical protein
MPDVAPHPVMKIIAFVLSPADILLAIATVTFFSQNGNPVLFKCRAFCYKWGMKSR